MLRRHDSVERLSVIRARKKRFPARKFVSSSVPVEKTNKILDQKQKHDFTLLTLDSGRPLQ